MQTAGKVFIENNYPTRLLDEVIQREGEIPRRVEMKKKHIHFFPVQTR